MQRGPLEEESEHVFFGGIEGESVRIEFQVNEDGSVPGFNLYRNGERIPVQRKDA